MSSGKDDEENEVRGAGGGKGKKVNIYRER